MKWLAWLLGVLLAAQAHAQWEMQDPHVTADLRGIDYVGGGVAWASGSHGTVLRTEDMGFVWQLCATPPEAKDLDFRGVQAFDNNTAIVMSSGPGNKSRLYKTTDGCQTWTLLYTNPDREGVWKSLRFPNRALGLLLGDGVNKAFTLFLSPDGGATWLKSKGVKPPEAVSALAASNSALLTDLDHRRFLFVTSGGAMLGAELVVVLPRGGPDNRVDQAIQFLRMAKGGSAGAASLAERTDVDGTSIVVVVGGDSQNANESAGSAAVVTLPADDTVGRAVRMPVQTEPHGYRSAVAYDEKANAWIAVGPNGTDVSADDGRNWRALKPSPGDAPDADRNWNALSLPFVVGPKGRIGILRDSALTGTTKGPDAKNGLGAK